MYVYPALASDHTSLRMLNSKGKRLKKRVALLTARRVPSVQCLLSVHTLNLLFLPCCNEHIASIAYIKTVLLPLFFPSHFHSGPLSPFILFYDIVLLFFSLT